MSNAPITQSNNHTNHSPGAGYKQTEVGVIPEDWVLDYIENLAYVTTGSRNTQDRIDDGQYPFFVRSQIIERINSYSFDGEAVLTAGDGVGTGKVFHYIKGKFDAHQRVYRISNFKEWVNAYFFYLYFSNHFYNRIMQMTAKSSVDSVRREMIAKMLIPLPPTLAEQRAIADALSDADALIESLEQLIAKRRAVKQGAMQALLRPKAGWHTECLGTLFHLSAGRSKSSGLSDVGRFIIMDMGSISPDGKTLVSKRTNMEEDVLDRGDLVMPKDDIGGGHIIGKVALIDFNNNYVLGDHVYRLQRRISCIESSFFYFLINSQYVSQELKKKVAGSAQLGLSRASVLEQTVAFPSGLDEQTAIAAVLSDMDAEIAALEAKLAKARQVKQGMMQELLTGRVRLV